MGKKRKIISNPQKYGKKFASHPLSKNTINLEQVESVSKPEPAIETKKPELETKKPEVKKETTPAPTKRRRRRDKKETN
tara:strand:- start:175 stop:411 length:237 start_codon:yes stop_codon:yes gene_type:complete